MPINDSGYEPSYAAALSTVLEGGTVANPLLSEHEATWPPSAEIVRLHNRLMDARRRSAPLSAEVEARAAEFLALTLQESYDARYVALRSDVEEVEKVLGLAGWRYNLAQRFIYWSPYAMAQMGVDVMTAPRTPEEAVGRFVHPDDRDYVLSMIKLTLVDGQPRDLRYRFLHPQKGMVWRLCQSIVHRNAEGQVTDVLFYSRDITEQVALEEQQRIYQAVFDHIQDVVLVTEAEPIDPPGPRIIYVNRAFEQMTGYTAAEAIGQTPRILQGPNTSPETCAQIRQALRNRQPITVEILNYRKDGSELWSELAITPVARPDEWVTYWVAVQRDITERRRRAARQQHLQKMQAVGELATGIAHNFNNLLAIIQGYGEIIKRDLHQQPKGQQRVEAILRAAKRGSQLVQELNAFCRQLPAKPVVVDVRSIAEEALDMVRPLLPAEIEVGSISGPSMSVSRSSSLLIEVDHSRFSQALLNLIINARDAMLPAGGHLEVAVGRRYIAPETLNHLAERLFYNALPNAGEYAWVSVRDTGIGMDLATQRRIFEPFFTTKPLGQGTGLGLAMVYGFVAECHGFITVASAPGQGTTITLYFPSVAAAVTQDDSSVDNRPAPLPLPADAAALVVEDERDLCDLIAEILTDLGFATVHRAYDGTAALECLQKLDRPLELVITDYSLPGASGAQVLAELAARGLGQRALLISGLSLQDKLPLLPTTIHTAYLNKPIRQSKLLEAIYRLLPNVGVASPDVNRKPS